jgi:NitT/TauT family transport system permease protein
MVGTGRQCRVGMDEGERWQDIAVGLVVPVSRSGSGSGWRAWDGSTRRSCRRRWRCANKWVAYLLPLQDFNTWHENNPAGGWLAWAFSGELIVDSLGSLYRVVVGFAVGAGWPCRSAWRWARAASCMPG